jgi:DNA-binding protein
MTTAELIALLKSEDPHGVREVVIWDRGEELIRAVERVELSDDRVVVEVSVELPHLAPS